MGSVWCVAPEDIKIDLDYVVGEDRFPFWIKIKRQLTIGEDRRVMTSGWRGMAPTSTDARGQAQRQEISINFHAQSFARTEAYLIDWSLTDDKDKKLALTREVIETLHPDVYGLIETAITAHVEAMASEKKVTVGSATPSAMSA